MNLDSVTKMLAVFATYWPNFSPVDGMAKSWTEALAEYEPHQAWDALKQFRSEEERKFAPVISEFIGRMDTLATIQKTQINDAKLLEAPPKKYDDEEVFELYAYQTSRTTPKRNKDDHDSETRKALRVTHSRGKDLVQRANTDGLRKVYISLPNNRRGFVWERI
jgi:hypothetical protein